MKKAANPTTEKAAKPQSIAVLLALPLFEFVALASVPLIVLAIVLEVGA